MSLAIALIDVRVEAARTRVESEQRGREKQKQVAQDDFRARLEAIWPQLEQEVLVAVAARQWGFDIWNPRWWQWADTRSRSCLTAILNVEVGEHPDYSAWKQYDLHKVLEEFLKSKFEDRVHLNGSIWSKDLRLGWMDCNKK